MATILFIRTESGNTECIFGRNGSFIIKSNYSIDIQQERDFMLEDMKKFLNDFFRIGYAEKSEEGLFFRFTNDKNEFSKIQDGEYTKSVNHQDNRIERGISVSTDMSYCALGAYDYFYKVSGKVIGRGSDGEPLLDAATMKKHSTYKSISCYCKKSDRRQKEKEEKFLEEYEWSADDLRNLMYLPAACRWRYINANGEIEDWQRYGNNQQKIFKKGEFETWQKK